MTVRFVFKPPNRKPTQIYHGGVGQIPVLNGDYVRIHHSYGEKTDEYPKSWIKKMEVVFHDNY